MLPGSWPLGLPGFCCAPVRHGHADRAPAYQQRCGCRAREGCDQEHLARPATSMLPRVSSGGVFGRQQEIHPISVSSGWSPGVSSNADVPTGALEGDAYPQQVDCKDELPTSSLLNSTTLLPHRGDLQRLEIPAGNSSSQTSRQPLSLSCRGMSPLVGMAIKHGPVPWYPLATRKPGLSPDSEEDGDCVTRVYAREYFHLLIGYGCLERTTYGAVLRFSGETLSIRARE